jgi:hypothetical protein
MVSTEGFCAVYYKPSDRPQLVLRTRTQTDDQAPRKAWQAVNDEDWQPRAKEGVLTTLLGSPGAHQRPMSIRVCRAPYPRSNSVVARFLFALKCIRGVNSAAEFLRTCGRCVTNFVPRCDWIGL